MWREKPQVTAWSLGHLPERTCLWRQASRARAALADGSAAGCRGSPWLPVFLTSGAWRCKYVVVTSQTAIMAAWQRQFDHCADLEWRVVDSCDSDAQPRQLPNVSGGSTFYVVLTVISVAVEHNLGSPLHRCR
jgi:hypothetical protein